MYIHVMQIYVIFRKQILLLVCPLEANVVPPGSYDLKRVSCLYCADSFEGDTSVRVIGPSKLIACQSPLDDFVHERHDGVARALLMIPA